MLFTFISFFLNLFSVPENVEDILGVPGPLQFNNADFNLSLSGRPEKGMSLHVYLPKGEDLDNYNQKISLIVLDTKKDLDAVVKTKLKDLALRKKTDLNCEYSAVDIVEGKDIIVEYLQSEMDGKKLSEAEYNVSRIKWLSDHDNGNYLLIYTYSWRTYEAEAADMIKNIQNYKTEYIQELSKKTLPEVNVK